MVEAVLYNTQENHLELLDQTLLPEKTEKAICENELDVSQAIISMQVRGAPAIGVAAAYGIVLGLKNKENANKIPRVLLDEICEFLAATRPTAVNLFWAIERVKTAILKIENFTLEQAAKIALAEADAIKNEDIEMCKKIGHFGAEFLKDGETWLTHCNAGALATAGYGTALGVFRTAKEQGKKFKVFVDETRPLLQGSRLTAWELLEEGIDATLICDNMAGSLMANGEIQGIVVGADRITADGFVANKIGTYSVAVLAKHHNIPFYVAAPDSTFDLSLKHGNEIAIEERNHDEVRNFGNRRTAPANMPVFNPAFDVTPPELVKAIFTNKGVLKPPFNESIAQLIGKAEK